MTPPQPLSPPSEQPPSPAYPGRLGAWLAFTRPKTWLLAVAPVLAALALAWAEAHAFSPVVALLTLTIAVLMQAPKEAVILTASYIRICGCGIFFIVAYISISVG